MITYLPPSVTCLCLPHNSMSPDYPPPLPPNLLSLCVNYGSEWKRVLHPEIDSKREFPQSIKELEIHLLSLPRLFNFPPNLTHLHIHVNDFNQPLDKLPPSLKFLVLNTRPRCYKAPKFDQPLNKLPAGLVCSTNFIFITERKHAYTRIYRSLLSLYYCTTTTPLINFPPVF